MLNGSLVEIDPILDRFNAGESIEELARDFKLSNTTIEQLLRASRQFAA